MKVQFTLTIAAALVSTSMAYIAPRPVHHSMQTTNTRLSMAPNNGEEQQQQIDMPKAAASLFAASLLTFSAATTTAFPEPVFAKATTTEVVVKEMTSCPS